MKVTLFAGLGEMSVEIITQQFVRALREAGDSALEVDICRPPTLGRRLLGKTRLSRGAFYLEVGLLYGFLARRRQGDVNHVIDNQGGRWGQMDGVGFAASSWRVGDTVMTWFDIPIAGEAPFPPYTLRVGMYTYPDVVGVSVLDVAGNPAGEFVDLGPVGETP